MKLSGMFVFLIHPGYHGDMEDWNPRKHKKMRFDPKGKTDGKVG